MRRTIAALSAILAMATTAYAQSNETTALTVTAAAPTTETWPNEIQASGWLQAWQEAVISAEVSGQKIVAVNAEVGETVAMGDVLVELSQDSINNDIRQLEASLESARATLDQATTDADRARRLNGTGSISQQQVTEYLVSERKAQADVDSAEAQLASSRLDLERTLITAVSDGRITARDAALGDVVSSGDELFRLIRDNRIEWQAEVPLKNLLQIEVGTEAILPTPLGDVRGKVRQIAPEASDTNGRVKVYVALEEPKDGPEPRVGVLVSGAFQIGESEAVTVPSSAVVLQDGFSYVFTVDATEGTATVSRERVTTGRHQGDRVEITSEIDKAAMVVQSGGAFLSEGSRVKVVEGEDTIAEGIESDLGTENKE